MTPNRISVKFFVKSDAKIELPALTPVFQKWIQRRTVEGLLIDVADYKHVPDGPGILLIAHEGDYALDVSDGKPGVQYTAKRNLQGDLPARLAQVWRLALIAAQKLSAEKSLKGLKFDYADVKLAFLDRLNTPNRPDVIVALQPDIRAFVSDLYQTDTLQIDVLYADPREALATHLQIEGDPDPETLLARLQTPELAAR
jgi:hypothetical protein